MKERERKSLIKKLTFYCPGYGCYFIKRGKTIYGKKQYECTTCHRGFIPRDKPIDFSTWTDIDKQLDKETHRYFDWKRSFDKLKAFHKKHGHTWPSQSVKIKEKKNLAMWASAQRTLIRRGAHHPLKKQLLESLGFPLDYHDYHDENSLALRRKRNKQQIHFPDQLKMVLAWKDKHGRWPSQWKGILKEEKYLGRVVNLWRQDGYLYDDQLSILDSHNFVWSLEDARFLKKIERIKAFKEKYGGYFLKRGQKNTAYDRSTSQMIAILRCKQPEKDWQKKIVKELQLGRSDRKKSKS
jgi:hypothetical protein